MTRLVVPLASASRADRPSVGGKAAVLGELLQAGFPVPTGFCVTCDAYRAHIETHGLGTRIRQAMETSDTRDTDRLAAAAADVRAWIESTPLAEDAREQITAAYEALGGNVAVRSSAVGEDLAEASFAGQHDSWLDVSGAEDVLLHVLLVWASLWSEHAVGYRARAGFDVADAAIAVVVQRMVQAQFAGVAFTADHYVAAKASGTLLDADDSTPEPAFLRPLVALAREVETRFGAPQDIEWAFAGGAVFLLQARPITNLKPEPVALAAAARPILAYSDRWREMAPGPLTPLMGDIAVQVIVPYLARSLEFHGFLPPALAATATAPTPILRGRLHVDLDFIGKSLFPGLDPITALDVMESGKPPSLRAIRPSVLVALAFRAPALGLRVMRVMRHLERMAGESREVFDRLLRPLEDADLGTWETGRLVAFLTLEHDPSFATRLIAAPPANVLARGLGAPFLSAVSWMATRWAGEPAESGGRLVAGLAGLVEVECAAALWDLAARAKEIPAVAAALETPDRALAALASAPEAAAWLEVFAAFLAVFGHRGIEEVEIERPRWRERPVYPLSVIANYMRCDEARAPRAVEERLRREREAIEARVAGRLGPIRRWIFRFALDVAQGASLAGENTKFDIVRLLWLWRVTALELGRRLRDEGRVERLDDVFFLHLHELRVPSSADMRAIVASRRSDHLRWQKEDPPRVIDANGRAVREGMRPAPEWARSGALQGMGSSPGVARGRVRIVHDPSDGVRLAPGEILVAPYTDPAWTPLFVSVGAVVVEVGSLLSHASIVARELGIPSVVALAGATRLLLEGEEVEVDGTRGTVRRIARME